MSRIFEDILIGIVLILLGIFLIIGMLNFSVVFGLVIILWGIKKAVFAGK